MLRIDKYLCVESDQKGGVEIFLQGIEIFRGVVDILFEWLRLFQ